MKLYSLCGAIWPNTLLHCGWILPDHPYGFHLLHSLNIQYDLPYFANDLHQMYLHMTYGQNLVHGEGTSLSRVGPYRFCSGGPLYKSS